MQTPMGYRRISENQKKNGSKISSQAGDDRETEENHVRYHHVTSRVTRQPGTVKCWWRCTETEKAGFGDTKRSGYHRSRFLVLWINRLSLHDPAILNLDIYPRDVKMHLYKCLSLTYSSFQNLPTTQASFGGKMCSTMWNCAVMRKE